LAILTEWDAFKPENLNYTELFSRMEKPACAFDGRNITNLADLRKIGFIASGIGKPR